MSAATPPRDVTGLYGNAQVPGDFGPAVTLADFWAHWKYTRADPGFQRLTARTAYYAVWDDHEVINDFGPLTDHSQTPPYTGEPLLPNGLAAFLDYNPIPQPALTPSSTIATSPGGGISHCSCSTRASTATPMCWPMTPPSPRPCLGANNRCG
jgi:hypothetical protein